MELQLSSSLTTVRYMTATSTNICDAEYRIQPSNLGSDTTPKRANRRPARRPRDTLEAPRNPPETTREHWGTLGRRRDHWGPPRGEGQRSGRDPCAAPEGKGNPKTWRQPISSARTGIPHRRKLSHAGDPSGPRGPPDDVPKPVRSDKILLK